MKTQKHISHIPRVTFRVIDPETNYSMNADEWMHKPEEIRQRAEWISIETDLGYQFLLHKKKLPADTWAKQQLAAKKVHPEGRCGTRLEYLFIQYARENFETDLDELLRAIGGDDFMYDWFWTEEKVQSNATGAWYFYGTSGVLSTSNARYDSHASRVLRAL